MRQKPHESGFMVGSSNNRIFFSDDNSQPRANATDSSVNCNDDHFISTPILQSTQKSIITRIYRRKARSFKVSEADEDLTMNRMPDRKSSPTYIKPAIFDCLE